MPFGIPSLTEPFRFGTFDSKTHEPELTRCCRASTVPVSRLFVFLFSRLFRSPAPDLFVALMARFRLRRNGLAHVHPEGNPAGPDLAARFLGAGRQTKPSSGSCEKIP